MYQERQETQVLLMYHNNKKTHLIVLNQGNQEIQSQKMNHIVTVTQENGMYHKT